jgi:membrane-bound lytic murein transglycosylase D
MKKLQSLQSFVLLFLFILFAGCASQKNSVRPSASELALRSASQDVLQLASAIEVETPRAVALTDSLRQARFSEAAATKNSKLAEATRLYSAALVQLETSPDAAKQSLINSLTLVNELLENEKTEQDTTVLSLAQYALLAYQNFIEPIDGLDSDSPVLAVYLKMQENVDEIVINEESFRGIVLPKTQIPLVLNSEVKKFIAMYSSPRMHKIMSRYLERVAIYFPTLKQIISETGAPPELIYLSIVESGVNPHAKSHANAVGMWQFVKGTGRMYGLEGNSWFDERRDIYKATKSSMQHLIDLNNKYHDWYLALAAYNAGGGRVNKGLRLSKQKDFWSLCKYFRRETKEYVPRFIAAAIVAMNPERFGFAPIAYAEPMQFETIEIPFCVELKTISKYSGVGIDSLALLNPELVKNMTPPAFKTYKLRVPTGTTDRVSESLVKIPDTQKRYFVAHKARGGETLKSLAKRYGTSEQDLRNFNDVKKSSLVKGNVVMIPASVETFMQASFTKRDLSDDSREARGRRRYARRRHKGKKKRAVAVGYVQPAFFCVEEAKKC